MFTPLVTQLLDSFFAEEYPSAFHVSIDIQRVVFKEISVGLLKTSLIVFLSICVA